MQLNPYIAGNPVHGHDRFIGRTDVLRDVSLTLNNPNTNAIVLFGQRRIGKTSVLLQLENELAAERKFIPVYFDLQDKASLPLGEVLYQIAQKVSSESKISVPEREYFEQEGIFFRDKFIPSAIQNNNNNGLVLLFDEFDVLDQPQKEQAGESFFPYLRKWMDTAVGVQFVFVLGRRPEELSTDTMSAFKAIRSRQVSLMKKEDSSIIIRQSEKSGGLKWSNEAEERVWYWTQGHPYLTQLLCSEIWEACIDVEQEKTSGIKTDQIDASIDRALEQGVNAFQWIWNGLPSAERVVMAAMAEAKGEKISQDDLSGILSHSKVRLILRELELAPETLVRWDLLRPADNGFRFAIPLLRRWVASEKPLRRVKAELDSMEPLAENLYNTGKGFLDMGNLAEAERQLRNALNVNPNHFRARLLLGQVLIGQGKPVDAVKELEPAYEFDPSSAKPGLTGALLALAETQKENEQLATYNRILEIDPHQSTALEKKKTFLTGLAEAALKKDDLATALEMYKQTGDQQGITHVETMLRKRELEKQLVAARKHEDTEDWSSAIDSYEKLLAEFPDEEGLQNRLKTARVQAKLAKAYTRALNALQEGDNKLSQKLFGEIIGIEPAYKDALRYLVLVVKQVDIDDLLQKNQKSVSLVEKLIQIDALEEKISETEKKKTDGSEQKSVELQKIEKVEHKKRSDEELPPEKQKILSIWNPLNYFRFFWMIFFQPNQFKQYQNYYKSLGGDTKEHINRQVSLLTNFLTWCPLLLWFSWSEVITDTIKLSPILILLSTWWIMTGICGAYYEDNDLGVGSAVFTNFVIGLFVAVTDISGQFITLTLLSIFFYLNAYLDAHFAYPWYNNLSIGTKVGVVLGLVNGMMFHLLNVKDIILVLVFLNTVILFVEYKIRSYKIIKHCE